MNSEMKSPLGIRLQTYEALLYWKHYSNPQAERNTYGKVRKCRNSCELKKKLGRLSKSLSRPVKDTGEVVRLVRSLDAFHLPGIQSRDALPTRTTLLHMIYPDLIPVFDKQVLKAVGVNDKHANTRIGVLREYLEHVWRLCNTHSHALPPTAKETPIRLIDMALWVTRGECKRGCS
jgi:hypothetical protein